MNATRRGRVAWILAASVFATACRREGDGPEPAPPVVSLDALDASLAGAIRDARAAVVREPKSSASWGRLGQTCEAAEFNDEARRCYGRAAVLDPGSARWHHLAGLRELAEQPEVALGHLARATELAGTNTDAPRLRWAQALVERGRLDDAAVGLKPLLDANPSHAAARLEMARIRLVQGNAESGAEFVGPCLTNPYTARPALLVLSQIRQRLGDGDGAAVAARRAAAMPRPFDWPDPFLREVQQLRKDRQQLADQANGFVMQNRLDDAERTLATLFAASPDDAEGLLVLGRLRLRQERCKESEEALVRHLKARPDSLNGLVQLGLARMCQSRWTDAAASFSRAVELKPDFAQAHFNLGLARSAAGDAEGAAEAVRQSIRCNPGEASFHGMLAELLARSGDAAGAREAAARALQLDPKQPRAKAVMERLGPGR